jgi:thiol-disulfide isomerase/thioredoxin
MGRAFRTALFAGVAAAALAVGVYLQLHGRSDAVDSAAVSALTQTKFQDLSGESGSLEQWRGRVLVVNFWASWCAPCREEIPGLVNIHREYAAKGLQIVGIAVDSADKARESASALGVNYPVLVAGIESIDLTRRLGNRASALPFTLVFDRSGKVIATHLGILSEAALTRIISPLLG